MAKQLTAALFRTDKSAAAISILLEKANECANGEVAIHVLSFFDKPMYTSKSIATQDLDSEEMISDRESVCGIFNDNVVSQVWVVLQRNDGEHKSLNQMIASVVLNTTVAHVDMCGKLAESVWAGGYLTAKWKSEQLRR